MDSVLFFIHELHSGNYSANSYNFSSYRTSYSISHSERIDYNIHERTSNSRWFLILDQLCMIIVDVLVRRYLVFVPNARLHFSNRIIYFYFWFIVYYMPYSYFPHFEPFWLSTILWRQRTLCPFLTLIIVRCALYIPNHFSFLRNLGFDSLRYICDDGTHLPICTADEFKSVSVREDSHTAASLAALANSVHPPQTKLIAEYI